MARNSDTNERMREQSRERILVAGLRLFSAKGLAATKISEIAAEAGLSLGLVYHYFESKEALFTVLIQEAFQRLNQAAQGLEAMDLDPKAKIRLAIQELLRGFAESDKAAWTHLLVFQASASEAVPQEVRRIIQQEGRVPYDVIERIIRQGQAEGVFKPFDPAQMALVFWTSIKGLALHKAVHGAGFQPPDPDILMDMFL